jgi:hypothetical protein
MFQPRDPNVDTRQKSRHGKGKPKKGAKDKAKTKHRKKDGVKPRKEGAKPRKARDRSRYEPRPAKDEIVAAQASALLKEQLENERRQREQRGATTMAGHQQEHRRRRRRHHRHPPGVPPPSVPPLPFQMRQVATFQELVHVPPSPSSPPMPEPPSPQIELLSSDDGQSDVGRAPLLNDVVTSLDIRDDRHGLVVVQGALKLLADGAPVVSWGGVTCTLTSIDGADTVLRLAYPTAAAPSPPSTDVVRLSWGLGGGCDGLTMRSPTEVAVATTVAASHVDDVIVLSAVWRRPGTDAP